MCSTDTKNIVHFGTDGQGENGKIQLTSLKCATEENGNDIDSKNNLLNAVKSVYVDSNVNLKQPKIFVGNISYKLSTHQLKEFFTSFGKVIYAQIVKDRVKKRSKG